MSTLTKAQKARWQRIIDNGCIVDTCENYPCIHHCETGAGGRKDHDKVIGLCHFHHQGEQGIHTLSRRIWQPMYGTERYLIEKTNYMLGEWDAAYA